MVASMDPAERKLYETATADALTLARDGDVSLAVATLEQALEAGDTFELRRNSVRHEVADDPRGEHADRRPARRWVTGRSPQSASTPTSHGAALWRSSVSPRAGWRRPRSHDRGALVTK
jgi:hypothetical protein